jgi:Fe-S cluster biogenesis protein NfuA
LTGVNVNATNDDDFRGRIGRIETLIDEIERFADPAAQERAREIVQALLDYHGAGLANLLGHIATAGTPGRAILEAMTRDDLVSSLLLLYGLHPHDLDARVSRALERVRPQLRTHGGDVELLGLDGGVVRLRMQGSCHGCPSSAATLRQTIETANYEAAPDVVSIEVEGAVGTADSSLLPIVTLGPTIAADARPRLGPA